jgi:ComF family protein
MNSRIALLPALAHLFFPHTCCGCGTSLLQEDSLFCIDCLAGMPLTGFEACTENPVEKNLRRRIAIHSASAHLYFTKNSAVRQSLHHFKYEGRKEIGRYLGRRMGYALRDSGRFQDCQIIIPLPLHAAREKARGYNQAAVLAESISEILQIPVAGQSLVRISGTATQTRRNRIQRWQNMANKFRVAHPEQITGKHILLVDDIITTGATLEACAQNLLGTEGVSLSIATLAYTVSG